MEYDSDNDIPYNPNNKHIITTDMVEAILKKYQVTYQVRNIEIFRTAFTHRSYLMRPCWTKEQLNERKKAFDEPVMELRDRSYEDLEFRGDAVLDFIVVDYITRRFPLQNEGFYTKLKSKMVNGATLARIAKNLGFHKYVMISSTVEEKNGRHSEKILEDVLEAFIGALYDDSVGVDLEDFGTCYRFIYNILDNVNHDYDYAQLILYDTNYKDQLLKYYHQNKWGNPQYVELSVEENVHSKIFSIGISDPLSKEKKKVLATGVGATKKKAEQLASKEALRFFGVLPEEF